MGSRRVHIAHLCSKMDQYMAEKCHLPAHHMLICSSSSHKDLVNFEIVHVSNWLIFWIDLLYWNASAGTNEAQGSLGAGANSGSCFAGSLLLSPLSPPLLARMWTRRLYRDALFTFLLRVEVSFHRLLLPGQERSDHLINRFDHYTTRSTDGWKT